MKREPVVTAAAVATVITTVAGAVGWHVDNQLVQDLAVAVAGAAPLVLGFLARGRVTPTHGKHEKP